MPEIRDARIYAFYLFDVCETAHLSKVPALIGGPTTLARLAPKSATPAYVQYDKPPLSFDGDLIGITDFGGFRPRFRVYDYGVISIALARPFSGSWKELVTLGQDLIENEELGRLAEKACHEVVARLRPALDGPRTELLSEDYLVLAVHELERQLSAGELVRAHGDDIAAMLRGERQPLSAQEKRSVLKHRISYLSCDLVVTTWNAALVYDTPDGAAAALEILEFANSQLLEFRYYDQLLDLQMTSIYGTLEHPGWFDEWIGPRYTRATRQVHSLFIDVKELTDRTENALKFIGDIYAVRLFVLVSGRLGLDTWKANIQGKLETLDAISRFAAERSSVARANFLELAIVLILVVEFVLLMLGVMS
jgi:hypothetical protein